VNSCLDAEESQRSEAFVGVIDVNEIVEVDTVPPGETAVQHGPDIVVIGLDSSAPARKCRRLSDAGDPSRFAQASQLPPPLVVNIGLPSGASGAVGMDVLTNVAGRMAAQFSIDKTKGLKCLHICSRFDLYSTTVSGAGWDCGYRNVMMLISALLRDRTGCAPVLARSALDAVPCIDNIQARIEAAWRRGFDPDGAKDYQYRLRGRRAWIGAVEVASMLRAMCVNAQVADFEKRMSASGDHRELLEWVLEYFETRCRAGACLKCRNAFFGRSVSFICPLLLQHEGHSRTISGIEMRADGTIYLLVCDPERSFANQLRECEDQGLGMAPMMRRVRVGLSGLNEEAYQIVHMPGNAADMTLTNLEDYERAKLVVNVRLSPSQARPG
jgi:Peptidase family C78